jgi:hypothetical protein
VIWSVLRVTGLSQPTTNLGLALLHHPCQLLLRQNILVALDSRFWPFTTCQVFFSHSINKQLGSSDPTACGAFTYALTAAQLLIFDEPSINIPH